MEISALYRKSKRVSLQAKQQTQSICKLYDKRNYYKISHPVELSYEWSYQRAVHTEFPSS